ncbi:MAG: hypothetical protein V3U70_01265 [Thermoplasmata archaeon]
MSEDLQAIMEEFDLDERERKLLRAVAALLEARENRERGETWDHDYKGHGHWLEFRARVLRIVERGRYVTWGLLDEDPWFRLDAPPKGEGGGMQDHKQWSRAITSHLIPNRPEANDGQAFMAFKLRERGTRYVTVRRYLHCAIAKAAEGRKKARGFIRELRRRYKAEASCAWDERRYGSRTVEDDLQPPVSPRTLPAGEESPTEEERALLQARSQSAPWGGD